MYEFNAGAIVKFTDNQWGVYGDIKSDSRVAELYGLSLLTAEYFARLYAMVKNDTNARSLLISCLENPTNLYAAVSNSLDGYAQYYGSGVVKLDYNLTEVATAKRECSLIVSYDLDGHFAPQFRPKGFGILGKNIEMASVSACLATSLFFIETRAKDTEYERIIMDTIEVLGSKILHSDKLRMKDEWTVVIETAKEVAGVN